MTDHALLFHLKVLDYTGNLSHIECCSKFPLCSQFPAKTDMSISALNSPTRRLFLKGMLQSKKKIYAAPGTKKGHAGSSAQGKQGGRTDIDPSRGTCASAKCRFLENNHNKIFRSDRNSWCMFEMKPFLIY